MRPVRPLLVKVQDDGVEVLAAPAPGRIRWRARQGETLVEGSVAGVLVQGERTYDLALPHGVHGQIRRVLHDDPWITAHFATPLAVLGAVEAEPLGLPASERDAAFGTWSVRSTTHGTFYRRPSPGARAFAEVGQELHAGATIGLVEVMKCFSPIAFAPPPGVETGVVREILAEDGAEIRADQELLRVDLR